MRIRSIRFLIISLATLFVHFGPAAAEISDTTESVDHPIAQPMSDEEISQSYDGSVTENDWIRAEKTDNADLIRSAPPLDLWERIRRGFAMAELDSEEVRHNEDYYASRPDYIKRITGRSKRYLFHIMQEVERRGMPAEIALLPIIESALNPRAHSHRQASGLWQLIPSTGKNYGLKQNWWYDERRDIIAATSAALDYLKKLHSLFGDWKLVLASYNWGEGAVGRALIKNRNTGLPADFHSITLPPETQNFIRRLIAVRNIISDPAAFGVELETIPNEPYFEKITATRHIDIKLAARLANIPLNEFKALNPAHNRPVINVDSSSTVLLPADKVGVFNENLKNHDKALVSWQAYRAREGDTLETIAARYGISAQRLKAVNDLDSEGSISPDETLLVPIRGASLGEDISVMSNKPARLKVPEGFFVYAVKKGDALFNIAKRHGITVAQIKSWNRSTDRLSIGQKLILKQT